MNMIIAGRGAGKTTMLIHMSHDKKIPILVPTTKVARFIKDRAKAMNLDIPAPVTMFQFLNNDSKYSCNNKKERFLIDELDSILAYIGIDAECATLTPIDDPEGWTNETQKAEDLLDRLCMQWQQSKLHES